MVVVVVVVVVVVMLIIVKVVVAATVPAIAGRVPSRQDGVIHKAPPGRALGCATCLNCVLPHQEDCAHAPLILASCLFYTKVHMVGCQIVVRCSPAASLI